MKSNGSSLLTISI